jgi:hypothetical protein
MPAFRLSPVVLDREEQAGRDRLVCTAVAEG